MHFPKQAPHTRILTQKGFNCAPWNIGGYRVTEQNGEILVDGERLVFFHFHGLKLHYGAFYFDCHREYGAPLPGLVRNRIYKPYVRKLLAQERRAQNILHTGSDATDAPLSRARDTSDTPATKALKAWLSSLKPTVAAILYRALDLATGRPIMVWRGRVW